MALHPTDNERTPDLVLGQASALAEAYAVLRAHEKRDAVLGSLILGVCRKGVNHIADAEPGRIFDRERLRNRCVRYRMRFLDAVVYRSTLPPRAVHAVHRLEERLGEPVRGLKVLTSDFGPRPGIRATWLMAPMSDGNYYLVDRWGGDPGPLRRWLVWPLASPWRLVLSVFAIGLLIGSVLPIGSVGGRPESVAPAVFRAVIILWCVILAASTLALCWLAFKGRFSAQRWNGLE